MLYHLFKYFDNVHNLPGAGMFQYISFRAAAAIIIAIIPVTVLVMVTAGKTTQALTSRKKNKETAANDGIAE